MFALHRPPLSWGPLGCRCGRRTLRSGSAAARKTVQYARCAGCEPKIGGELVIHDKDGLGDSAQPGGARAFVRKHRIALILLAAILLAAVLIARHFSHKSQATPGGLGGGPGGQGGPVPVSVATASYGDIQLRIPALG